MSELHKFKVEHEVGAYYPWQAKCFIDDKNVKIRGYTLEHYVDDVPKINIDMQIDAPDIENVEAEIKIANKEEIAALMDREEFEEFCKIWGKVHKTGISTETLIRLGAGIGSIEALKKFGIEIDLREFEDGGK